jgi:hypothetical protein
MRLRAAAGLTWLSDTWVLGEGSKQSFYNVQHRIEFVTTNTC